MPLVNLDEPFLLLGARFGGPPLFAVPESPRDLARRIVELSKADAGHVIIATAITDQMLGA
jgi:hypothetical protein